MKFLKAVWAVLLPLMVCSTAMAHVQVLVPSDKNSTGKGSDETLNVYFVEHVMKEAPVYSMAEPKQFGVLVNGRKLDLRGSLQKQEMAGKAAFTAAYTMKEPGAHVFYLEPAPYWDPEEEVAVTHYTKVILNSCDGGLATESQLGWENWEGWDALVGFPVEIEPLVQCTSLWTNSLFRGIVRVNGKPAPFARIEVEYLNGDRAVTIPNNAFVTQILKSDENGVFSFAPVKAGWWALSAIIEPEQESRGPNGEEVETELGGVLWIHCTNVE